MVDEPEPNRDHIATNLAKSLMLVTALNPRIGYDKADKSASSRLRRNITSKQAAAETRFRPAGGFRSLGCPGGDDHAGSHAAREAAASGLISEASRSPATAPALR